MGLIPVKEGSLLAFNPLKVGNHSKPILSDCCRKEIEEGDD